MWPFIIWVILAGLLFRGIAKAGNRKLVVAGMVLLAVKVIASLLVSWYYVAYATGGGDTLRYFADASNIIAGSFSEMIDFYRGSAHSATNFDTDRTALFIKLLIPLVWISAGNFWLTSLMTGILSFALPFFIYLRYRDQLKAYRYQLILVLFILPSSLIWTSGIFKENIAMILLMLFFLPFLEYQQKHRVYQMPVYFWLISILSFFFFIQLRYFIAILVIPVVGIIILAELERSLKFKIGFALFVLASFILFMFIHPVLNPESLPHYLFDAHFGILASKSGSIPMYFNVEHRGWYDILRNIPHSLENVFLRPYPWEWNKIEYVVYALENYLMLLIAMAGLLSVRNFNLWHLVILFIMIIGISLISIATPNLGSLFRYRALLFPFIAFLFSIHIPFDKLFGTSKEAS